VRQVKLALIIAILNFLLSVYYLIVGFKLSALFLEFNARAPNPIFNKYFLGYLLVAILTFVYWYYLKRSIKRGLRVNKKIFNLILLLLAAPIIYIVVTEIYSLIIIYIVFPLTI